MLPRLASVLRIPRSPATPLRPSPRRFRWLRLPWVSLSIVTVLVVCAAFAPWLAPHDPRQIDMNVVKMAPWEDMRYPLGTDILGRDMLSRLIYGARTSIFMALVALGSGALTGTLLGLIAGYRGGWVDAVIMRATDASLGFPTILVAMVAFVLLGAGMEVIVLAVGLNVWDRFSRMVRGDVLYVKQLDYVTMARIGGVSAPMIVWRHIFPNVVNTFLVITSLQVGQVILLEASLSFLGLGLAPGAPAWGIMVAEGRAVILDVWWLSLLPGIAITTVVLALNFFGDWMRDSLDPKLRRV
ncbi:MAG: ABC transporter permease [SAR202 cluster bacterium]|nr:ABC transporter permease [SAR202 cluster bacterium]